jgi:hypothetical protein
MMRGAGRGGLGAGWDRSTRWYAASARFRDGDGFDSCRQRTTQNRRSATQLRSVSGCRRSFVTQMSPGRGGSGWLGRQPDNASRRTWAKSRQVIRGSSHKPRGRSSYQHAGEHERTEGGQHVDAADQTWPSAGAAVPAASAIPSGDHLPSRCYRYGRLQVTRAYLHELPEGIPLCAGGPAATMSALWLPSAAGWRAGRVCGSARGRVGANMARTASHGAKGRTAAERGEPLGLVSDEYRLAPRLMMSVRLSLGCNSAGPP